MGLNMDGGSCMAAPSRVEATKKESSGGGEGALRKIQK